ncbi:hypothetical protein LSAT2_022340 [Lamellibrachia satsuma]|nr:hypothetical protein LSAT2_022340 [Lamellibrachia satsuma]
MCVDKQEESWITADLGYCGAGCSKPYQECMCGTRIGQYTCVCSSGYEMLENTCSKCKKGYYKESSTPEPCRQCPANTTTDGAGATRLGQCQLLPGMRVCPELPDLPHAKKFYVTGTQKNEVLDTGVECMEVTDGNSCHYQCAEGYRLSGTPILICNSSGEWEGDIPNCTMIDCDRLENSPQEVLHATIDYVNETTAYKSLVEITCDAGRVALGHTTWTCDKHGRWTKPRNFICAEVLCPAPFLAPFISVEPDDCQNGNLPLNKECMFTCASGFERQGSELMQCSYDGKPVWASGEAPTCKDIEAPSIACPPSMEVEVAHWGLNYTVVHYDYQKPRITDNSGQWTSSVTGPKSGSRFYVGHTTLTYHAVDKTGLSASCEWSVTVKAKYVDLRYCPTDIQLQTNSPKRTRQVEWPVPQFIGEGDSVLPHTCTPANGSEFSTGNHSVVCYADNHPDKTCKFHVNIFDPACPIPFVDRLPVFGALICGTADHAYPRYCRIHCKEGYAMRNYNYDHKFICRWDGTWSVKGKMAGMFK